MIRIGSARHNELGKTTGGRAGDSLQNTQLNDTLGEVSLQKMYNHTKGWYVLRPKSTTYATNIANAMYIACCNPNIGYGQECQRLTTDNIHTVKPINVDCSKLVRDVIFDGTGIDVGNFTTLTEKQVLEKSGLFETAFKYVDQKTTPIYNGDVLVTRTKGHTAVVIDGSPRVTTSIYYPRYNGTSNSIVTALKAVGEYDATLKHRYKIALANGITNYSGTASENLRMVRLIKAGKLIKV